MTTHKNEFITLFQALSRHRRQREVLDDFARLTANLLDPCASNSPNAKKLTSEIAGRYSIQERKQLENLLRILIEGLQYEWSDFLGACLMELSIGNDDMGQYFTPDSLARLKSKLTLDNYHSEIKKHGFMTVHEPTCGAGGLVIAIAGELAAEGYNPAEHMFACCIDIDYLAADLAYIQLSLLGIAAEVITGNTLTMKFSRTRYTPAYYLNGFNERLRFRHLYESITPFFAAV